MNLKSSVNQSGHISSMLQSDDRNFDESFNIHEC
jgi:hypothetical protein